MGECVAGSNSECPKNSLPIARTELRCSNLCNQWPNETILDSQFQTSCFLQRDRTLLHKSTNYRLSEECRPTQTCNSSMTVSIKRNSVLLNPDSLSVLCIGLNDLFQKVGIQWYLFVKPTLSFSSSTTQRFNTARRWTRSWATSSHLTALQSFPLWFILILYSLHLLSPCSHVPVGYEDSLGYDVHRAAETMAH